MRPARTSRLFARWFASHARRRITSTFGEVRAYGLAEAREALAQGSIVVVSNHSSWWDALVALHVTSHLLEAEGYAMMDATNLDQSPFFGLVGAFGVDRSDARDGARVIRYAARLLRTAGRVVWIFPQGEERPSHAMPLAFQSGAAAVARLAHAATVPVGLRYVFGPRELPDLYISFGPHLAPMHDVALCAAEQERAVGSELARIDKAIAGHGEPFNLVSQRSTGPLARFGERALAWVTRAHAQPPR